jgi:uncharacterized membrane protein
LRRRRDEQGAVALFVAILATVILAMAMIVVDIGMQRVLRRDMQALADVVALDLARELDGRDRSVLAPVVDPGSPSSALSLSLARNDGTIGAAPEVTATLGGLVDGLFDPTVDPPTAVQVVATSSVDYAIAPGDGAATRSAIGAASTSACFSVGSYAARFRSGDAVLLGTLVHPMNALLRPRADLDVLSYEGLASSWVSLNELVAGGSLGTVDQLLTGQVTAGELVAATITALQRQTPANSVAVTALRQVLRGRAELDVAISLRDVLSISPSDTAAADVQLNALDLVTGALLVADGEHFLDLGNLSAGIGNMAPVGDARLTVIERPRVACGPFGSTESTAQSSQLRADAQMKLQLPSINGISGATGVVHTPEATVDIDIDLGNATGTLAGEPVCREGTATNPDLVDVEVRSGLSTFGVLVPLTFKAKVSVVGVGVVDVRFTLSAAAQQVMSDVTSMAHLRVPPNDSEPVTTGTSAPLGPFAVGSTTTNLTATVSGVTVSNPVTLDLVRAALAPLVAQLQVHGSVVGPLNALVDSINARVVPLRTLMGLNVAGADVVAVGRPVCGAPALRG